MNYRTALADVTPWDLGNISYSLRGTWLIEQKLFNNISNPNDFTESASLLFYPRVRMTSTLSYSPTSTFTASWIMDWQTSQDIVQPRDQVANIDSRPAEYYSTGNFARHDLQFRYAIRDDLDLRFGVTNVTNAEQAPWLGTTLYSNFDPYGRRFNIGFNFRPF